MSKNVKLNEVKRNQVMRTFVGTEELSDVLMKTMGEQVDTVVKQIYDAIQANVVTSPITNSEGEEV